MYLESDLQKACVEILHKNHRVIRIANPSRSGDSDTVACIYGFYVEIEFKKVGGIQSDLQKIAERKCKKAQGQYWLIDNVSDLLEKINKIKMAVENLKVK